MCIRCNYLVTTCCNAYFALNFLKKIKNLYDVILIEAPNAVPTHSKLHQLLLEERIENGYSNPARLVKLKKRQLNGPAVDAKSGKSYMEKFLETPSPDPKMIYETSIFPLPVKPALDDSSETGMKVLEISSIKKSFGDENSCSPPYEQEFQLNQFPEEVGEANGDLVMVKEQITVGVRDGMSFNDVKVSDEAELAISEQKRIEGILERVLIVDRDTITLNSIIEMCIRCNYLVTTCCNAYFALNFLKKIKNLYDVILIEAPNAVPTHSKLHQLLLEERIENGYSNPARLVKLKKRQLNGPAVDAKSGKSYMEKFLETPSPDPKMIYETSIFPLPVKQALDDSSETGMKVLEISSIKKSFGDENSCSPPYEQEFQLNQFPEEVGEANGDLVMVKEQITVGVRDGMSFNDVKVSDEAELAISEQKRIEGILE
ncbi:hypothetical protein RYX36_007246, partial [Vicia faba]